MFRRFISDTNNSMDSIFYGTLQGEAEERAKALFNLHPAELQALLEMAWSFRVDNQTLKLGNPYNKSDLVSLPSDIFNLFPNIKYAVNLATFTKNASQGAIMWDHLIYAYCIESTQIIKIFQKAIDGILKGNYEINLDAPTQQWLHNTESLWFRDTAPFSTFNIVSSLRPDLGATRRSAYYRFFGFTLPGDLREDGAPYSFAQPKSSNTNFRRNFERFCEEVWVGITNKGNTSGYNPTDNAVIAFNAFEMQKNFRAQRNNGDISKQEFYFVSMMSWFHLALEFNSPIVRAFSIEEESPAQRLYALANIVGIPANGLSENLFRLSDPLSVMLTTIETGIFNEKANQLYGDDDMRDTMRTIIFNWSQLTGVDLKVRQGQNTAAYPVQQGNGLPVNNGLSLALPG